MTRPLYSASQITQYRDCARKWAWRYLAGIKTPQHPGAALGQEVDDTQVQPYLRDGRPFDFTRDSGYIAASVLGFLPKPKTPGLEIQRHFILPSPASGGEFSYQGYIDIWLPDSALAPDLPGGAPLVADLKTTSDLKWAKSAGALSVDVQAMLYATHALYETKATVVDLAWIYAQTKGPRKAKRTHLRVATEHVAEQFEAIENTALEIHDAKARNVDPLSLPPTPTHCGVYGGCPYRDRCNLSPADHIAALAAPTAVSANETRTVMNLTESLLATLRAKKPALSVPQPSPAPVALGINPPEKDIPAPAETLPEPPPKRGPGRPKKASTKDPLGADAAVALPTQLPLPGVDTAPTVAFDYAKLASLIVDELANRLGGR